MRIKSLVCKNFKAFEHQSFSFGDSVRIFGENFKGKTSIAEAICVALYGCTLTGSPQVDHLIRKGTKKFEISVVVEVNREDHEITRVRGKKTEIYLDGRESTQAEIDKLLPDKDKFLTVFIPGFFTDKPEREGREMLMNLIKPPSKDEVLAQLSPSDQERLKDEELRNPDELAKEKRAEVKEHAADILRIEGRIEAVQERLARPIPPEPMAFDDTELNQLRAEVAKAESGNNVEIAGLQGKSKSLGAEYQALKKQLRSVPTAPHKEGDACPVCKRELTDDALGHALAHHNADVAAIEKNNAELVSRMQSLVEEGKKINELIAGLQANIHEPDAAVIARIRELEAEQSNVAAHNRDIERMKQEMEEDQKSLQGLRAQIADLQSRQTRLEEVIRSVGEYRAKLAEMQVEQLSKHLNRVSIQLFDVVKSTGEIKPAFHVLYDDKPYKSLSYSEGIRSNLELCSLFNKVLGYDIPIYIDNAESITHFDTPAASQLFLAHVVKGQELTVESDAELKGDVA